MARIRWIHESEASGPIAELYEAWKAANPGRTELPGIYKSLSLNPDLLRGIMDIAPRVHFSEGQLSRRHKEMIATYVSALNRCPY